MDPNRFFSGCNLKNAGRKEKLGYAKNVQFGLDLFHTGSALVESKFIKRKRGY